MARPKSLFKMNLLRTASTKGIFIVLTLTTSGCCSTFGLCPPAQSQDSYYDALRKYAANLNQNVFNNDPNFTIVPATGVIYPIGTVLINGNGVNTCAIDNSMIRVGQPMASQPPVVWSTSGGLSGNVPASMLGGLVAAGLSFKIGSSASLSMVDPITEDEVSLDNFRNKVTDDPACLRTVNGRKVDLVRGVINAREKWSWLAGQTAGVNANIGPMSAGPSFNINFENGNVPVAIEQVSPSARFYVVTPISAQATLSESPSGTRPSVGFRSSVDLKASGTVDPKTITTLSPR